MVLEFSPPKRTVTQRKLGAATTAASATSAFAAAGAAGAAATRRGSLGSAGGEPRGKQADPPASGPGVRKRVAGLGIRDEVTDGDLAALQSMWM